MKIENDRKNVMLEMVRKINSEGVDMEEIREWFGAKRFNLEQKGEVDDRV